MEAKNNIITNIENNIKTWTKEETIIKMINIYLDYDYTDATCNSTITAMLEYSNIKTTYNKNELLEEINSYYYLDYLYPLDDIINDIELYDEITITEDQKDRIYEEINYLEIDQTILNYILEELATDDIYCYFSNLEYYSIYNPEPLTTINNKIELTQHLTETIKHIKHYKPNTIYQNIIETLETETIKQITNIIKTT